MDRQDFTPLYYQLAEKIKGEILSGVIKAKERLPAEDQLAARLKVSRVTVRSALKKLEAEGFLFRVKNKGTFASPSQRRQRRIILVSDILGESRTLHSVIAGAISFAQREDIRVEVHQKSELAKLIPDLRNNERYQSGVVFMLVQTYNQGDLDALDRANIPWLVQGWDDGGNRNYCDIDDEAAMAKVVDHLADLGHRRFSLLSFDEPLQKHFTRRCDAARKRMAERGAAFDPKLFMAADPKDFKASIEACCEKLFADKGTCPTALLCTSDLLAVTAVQWFVRNGLSVPGHVSVTGFDNEPFTWVITPKVTTVDLSFFRWGAAAAGIMAKLMDDFSNRKIQQKMELELMIRESTGAPRG